MTTIDLDMLVSLPAGGCLRVTIHDPDLHALGPERSAALIGGVQRLLGAVAGACDIGGKEITADVTPPAEAAVPAESPTPAPVEPPAPMLPERYASMPRRPDAQTKRELLDYLLDEGDVVDIHGSARTALFRAVGLDHLGAPSQTKHVQQLVDAGLVERDMPSTRRTIRISATAQAVDQRLAGAGPWADSSKERVLAYLADVGGQVVDGRGGAAGLLMMRAGVTITAGARNQMLSELEHAGLIVRETGATKTYRIALADTLKSLEQQQVAAPEPEPVAEVEPEDDEVVHTRHVPGSTAWRMLTAIADAGGTYVGSGTELIDEVDAPRTSHHILRRLDADGLISTDRTQAGPSVRSVRVRSMTLTGLGWLHLDREPDDNPAPEPTPEPEPVADGDDVDVEPDWSHMRRTDRSAEARPRPVNSLDTVTPMPDEGKGKYAIDSVEVAEELDADELARLLTPGGGAK